MIPYFSHHVNSFEPKNLPYKDKCLCTAYFCSHSVFLLTLWPDPCPCLYVSLYQPSISLFIDSSQERMARMVFSINSSSVQPRFSAPSRITSLEHPAANFLSLNFFLRLETSISITLREGTHSLLLPYKICKFICCNSTFSYPHVPALHHRYTYPWLQIAWISLSSAPASLNSSSALIQCCSDIFKVDIVVKSIACGNFASSLYPSSFAKPSS